MPKTLDPEVQPPARKPRAKKVVVPAKPVPTEKEAMANETRRIKKEQDAYHSLCEELDRTCSQCRSGDDGPITTRATKRQVGVIQQQFSEFQQDLISLARHILVLADCIENDHTETATPSTCRVHAAMRNIKKDLADLLS